VAYILKLLDQYREFDALHWFDSVEKKFKEEQHKLSLQKSDKKEEQKSSDLASKRYDNYRRGFQLLRFSFLGARIFFRDDEKKKEEEKPAETTPTEESNGTVPTEQLANGTTEDEFGSDYGPPPIPPRDEF